MPELPVNQEMTLDTKPGIADATEINNLFLLTSFLVIKTTYLLDSESFSLAWMTTDSSSSLA